MEEIIVALTARFKNEKAGISLHTKPEKVDFMVTEWKFYYICQNITMTSGSFKIIYPAEIPTQKEIDTLSLVLQRDFNKMMLIANVIGHAG